MLKLERVGVDTVNRNPASSLAAENVRMALRAIASEYSAWPWLNGEYTANTWVQEKANLPGSLLHLHHIFDKGSKREVIYQDELSFSYRTLVPYSGSNGGSYFYTITGDDFRFNPYPTDFDARNNISFKAAILLPDPVQDTDVIQIPDRDINMLVYRVLSMMAVDHMKDTGLAQLYSLEYGRALAQAKNRVVTDSRDKRQSMIW
jgi:hypothetical protein